MKVLSNLTIEEKAALLRSAHEAVAGSGRKTPTWSIQGNTPEEQIQLLRAAVQAALKVLHKTGVSKRAIADQMRFALEQSEWT